MNFVSHSNLLDRVDATTFWEQSGMSRWSRYLESIERDVMSRALSRYDAPGRAIEIGCDGGKWSKWMHDRGWEMTCVDVNADALDLCKRRIPEATVVLAEETEQRYSIEDQFDFLFAI